MLLEHFGLQLLPFENVPDPLFFFDDGDYGRIYKRIIDSMEAGRGLMLVTGPVGSGKTTLSQKIIFDFSKDIRVLIWLAEPPATTSDLFLFIAQELDINPSISKDVFMLRDIRKALLRIKDQNKRYLMIMDESHLISDEVLNGIRLLNNLEDGSAKLIQTLILGQSELLDIINRPDMEFFKQRINTLEILGKMDTQRTRKYIDHRIKIAGGSYSIFSDTSLEAISIASNGIPRKINTLCSQSLNLAYERDKKTVDIHEIYEIAKDMGVGPLVFHYMLEMELLERKNQTETEKELQLLKNTEEISEKNVSLPATNDYSDALLKETINRNIIDAPSENPPTIAIEENAKEDKVLEPVLSVTEVYEQNKKNNLKTPILILLLSLVVLSLSLVFYSSRAGCSDLWHCLVQLIGI